MEESSKGIRKTPTISFVVVNYNGEEYLPECLLSLEREDIDSEIIVVDNGSSDSSKEIIQKYKVTAIYNERNRGYPFGVNQGIKRAIGQYIFLLSPATFLLQGTALKMLKGMEFRNVSVVAPMLVDEKGRIIHSVRNIPEPFSFLWEGVGGSRFFSWVKFIKTWKLPGFNYSIDQFIEQPMSCALMIKREIFDEIGLFDERFFLYFSDVDFSKRLQGKYKTLYLSTAKVVHKRGGTTYLLGPQRIKFFNRDLISYIRKYHQRWLPFIGILIISIGELRYLYSKIIHSIKS